MILTSPFISKRRIVKKGLKMEENKYILEFRNVSKSFGSNQVLKGINFQVRKGTVHALMGENGAGKSTMMKCLFGIYSKDSGEIYVDGEFVNYNSPKQALEEGVSMVHQELNQCLDRTVLDNFFLGRYPGKFGIVNKDEMYARASAVFKSIGVDVDLNAFMKKMSVSNRQMVEIAKAVSYKAKVIILDEPTSSLTEKEVKKLFQIINNLKKQGISFVYISHKMDEIFAIADDVSVMRDGQMIMTKLTKDTNMNELISKMVGRPLENRFPVIDNIPSEKENILEVSHLYSAYDPKIYDVSFNVKKNEIFGIYGLVGARRSELLEVLFGMRKISSGSIKYKNRQVFYKSSTEAIEDKIAFVTEERKFNGLFLVDSIKFNSTIACLNKYTNKLGILSESLIEDATLRQVKNMKTKVASINDPITSLSGGNQQKVILGRWLETNPDLFLLDEPTRGIDVGAKYEIYELIVNMVKQGKSCIVVSSEMPEILGITNRIMVLSNGRVAGIVNTKQTNQEELLQLATKYL